MLACCFLFAFDLVEQGGASRVVSFHPPDQITLFYSEHSTEHSNKTPTIELNLLELDFVFPSSSSSFSSIVAPRFVSIRISTDDRSAAAVIKKERRNVAVSLL